MERNLKRLIQAEQDARAIIDDANREAEQTAAEINKKIQRIADETRAQIAALRSEAMADFEKELQQMRVDMDRKVAAECSRIDAGLSIAMDAAVEMAVDEIIG